MYLDTLARTYKPPRRQAASGARSLSFPFSSRMTNLYRVLSLAYTSRRFVHQRPTEPPRRQAS